MIKVVTDYLEESAKRLPEKTMYVDPERSATFSEIRTTSRNVAQAIANEGIFKQPIALYIEKSITTIEALYGIAYSGNFYTVLDTDMPQARVDKILETLVPAAIITDEAHKEKVEGFFGDAKVLTIEELKQASADDMQLAQIRTKMQPTDLLYVLFTSGSTGIPKGVTTSHLNYINYMEAATEAYELDENDVMLNQVPFYFVMGGTDILMPAKNGCQMHIIPKTYYSFPMYLVNYIHDNQCTFLYWVPSAMAMISNTKAFDVADITCVKKVVFGGEVMPIKIIKDWIKHVPGAFYINGYGSTEVTDGGIYYKIDRDFEDTDTLPIGIPYPNIDCMVIGDDGKLITPDQVDEVGELLIRSVSVSPGYFKDPVKTAEVFIQNPLNDAYEEKVYKMGDLVRYNSYGELEYVGRADTQIKHRGQRIELGEIEANAASIEGVTENACFYDKVHEKIVMYYSGDMDEKTLGKKLKEMLPSYMLPGKRYRLDEMPHNLNGKIDRAYLKSQVENQSK